MTSAEIIRPMLDQKERLRYMQDLSRVVRETGEKVLRMGQKQIFDTVEVRRHPFSTVDAEAGSTIRAALEQAVGTFPGTILEESDIPLVLIEARRITYPLLVCDAVEGSTNAKRGLAAYFRKRPILAGTLAMLLETEELGTLAASAFYDFASQIVFSSVRTEHGCFLAFADDHLIYPADVVETKGDSHLYAVIPGYSHENVEARAEVERALLNVGVEGAGGSRSSAQDLVNLLCNQVDAYVDLRTLFPEGTESRDEVLHVWDVGGLLPVLDAVGFRVTDAIGQCWQTLRMRDRFAIIAARPNVHERILTALRALPFVAALLPGQEATVVPFPTPSLG